MRRPRGRSGPPLSHSNYGHTIRLGARCFVNCNCVFLDCAPIEIGDGCVIGAGRVVTRDLPPRVLAAGHPARIIRHLA
ncbi:MAG TPA: DapH/DapD/GlmU-related protein [Stellaceae bacterium]